MSERRPKVRIRLRYDMESGQFDLIVDDSAPNMPEDYHDEVAERVARLLSHTPEITNAGMRHVVWGEKRWDVDDFVRSEETESRDELTDG